MHPWRFQHKTVRDFILFPSAIFPIYHCPKQSFPCIWEKIWISYSNIKGPFSLISYADCSFHSIFFTYGGRGDSSKSDICISIMHIQHFKKSIITDLEQALHIPGMFRLPFIKRYKWIAYSKQRLCNKKTLQTARIFFPLSVGFSQKSVVLYIWLYVWNPTSTTLIEKWHGHKSLYHDLQLV